MSESLQVNFESPQSGWMSLSLEAGNQQFLRVVSCKPYNSLKDLIESLDTLIIDKRECRIKWNCEPEEFDFQIKLEGEIVKLDVIRFQDHNRLDHTSQIAFSIYSSALDLCVSFWKALRDLRRRIIRDEFDKNWRRPFPHQELNQLTKAIRSQKHKKLVIKK
jgi:hypothetical protein